MRVAATAAAAASLAALVACGGDPGEAKAGALRVEVVTALADGDAPKEGWSLEDEGGATRPLVPESTAPGRLLLAGRGPAGRYLVRAPKGHGVVDRDAKAMQPGLPPVTVFAGRERTLYLTPAHGWRVKDAVVVPGSGGSLVKDEVSSVREAGADGRLAVRIDVEAWKASPVGATALLEPVESSRGSRFSVPVRVTLPADASPAGTIVEPASAHPFQAHLFAEPSGDPLSGEGATAYVSLGWLRVQHDAVTSRDGVARFDELPGGSAEMKTRVLFRLGEFLVTDAREIGEARLGGYEYFSSEFGQFHFRIEGEPVGRRPTSVSVQARPTGASSYARVTVSDMDAAVSAVGSPIWTTWSNIVHLPAGAYGFLVRREGRGAIVAQRPLPHTGSPPVLVRLDPLCVVQGTIGGQIGTGRRLDLFARRLEDGKPVEAEGWVLRGRVRAEFELLLPVGEWQVTAEDAAGKAGPVTSVSFEKPGSRASIRVEAPP